MLWNGVPLRYLGYTERIHAQNFRPKYFVSPSFKPTDTDTEIHTIDLYVPLTSWYTDSNGGALEMAEAWGPLGNRHPVLRPWDAYFTLGVFPCEWSPGVTWQIISIMHCDQSDKYTLKIIIFTSTNFRDLDENKFSRNFRNLDIREIRENLFSQNLRKIGSSRNLQK